MANRFGNIGGTVSVPNGTGEITPQIIQAMKRRAQLGSAGVNRLAQLPFNPQIQNLDIPQGYGARNDYKRYFFKTNPIVGNAIELHCHDELTECSTRAGWKSYETLTLDDEVETYSTLTGELEFQKPSLISIGQYRGEMVRFTGAEVDILVTPGHRMWTAHGSCIHGVTTAYEFLLADEVEVRGEFLTKDSQGIRGVNWEARQVVPYEGKVWCVTVPNGAFVTRRNGQVTIQGNSEMPLSDFHLEHEDGAIEEFLNDMLQEANFFSHMLMAAVEWWLIGEFNSFAFFDDTDNPACYTNFVLLDPNKLTIASNNMVQGHQKQTVQLSFDAAFMRIVENGPNHRETGDLYQHLPSDMMAYAKARQPMPLSPLQVSRMKRGGYFNQRGESSLERVFPLLMLKDEMRTMQRAIAKRAISPIELWRIGETGEPADQAEIENFRELLQATYYDVGSALVWHHAINCQVIGAEGRMPQLWSEFDAIDNEVCAGLLINKGLILGDSSTFASDIVRMDVLINRYLMFRTKIEQWILQDVLAPILKIHEMYVPESKVKSMRFREMCGKGRPLAYPKIRWDKQSLRDETAKMDLMTKLVEKKLVPESTMIRMLNIDPRTAADKVEKESMDKIERHVKILKQLQDKGIQMTPEIAQILGFEGPPAGGAPSEMGGMPTSIGGGGEPMSSMPNEMAGLPEVVPGANPGGEGGQSAGIPKADGVQGSPSESQMPVGLPVG